MYGYTNVLSSGYSNRISLTMLHLFVLHICMLKIISFTDLYKRLLVHTSSSKWVYTHFHGVSLTSTTCAHLNQAIDVNFRNRMTSFNIEKRPRNSTRLNDQAARKSESCTTSDTILAAGLRRIGSTDPIWVTRPSVCPSLYPFLSAFLAYHVRSFVRSFPPFGLGSTLLPRKNRKYDY